MPSKDSSSNAANVAAKVFAQFSKWVIVKNISITFHRIEEKIVFGFKIWEYARDTTKVALKVAVLKNAEHITACNLNGVH